MFLLWVQVITFTLCNAHNPVVISRGAFITPVEAVVIYNDVELVHHLIGDLPEPPTSIARVCHKGVTKRACSMSTHLDSMVQDSTFLLAILNKARTTYGLKQEDLPTVYLNQERFQPVTNGEVSSDPPGDELVRIVGKPWFEQVKGRLTNRKPHFNDTKPANHHLVRRWIQYLKPLLIGGTALMGVDDLLNYAEQLFVGDNGILKFLTTLHAVSPDKSFVDLSNRVSEFEARSRSLTADIALDTEQLKLVTDQLQLDVQNHKMDLSTVEDSHITSQQILGDFARIVFTQMVYFAYMDADTNCRSGYLSPILIPPALLAKKLTEVVKNLPHDMKLALGLDDIQRYYTRKYASCMYDSNGGLVTINVPIVHKNVQLKLYEYRNIFFQWEQRTCTLDSASRYVVKDLKSNHVWPIEDVDTEKCLPHIMGKCKVPPFSDSSDAYCLNQILSSSTVSQVRDACKMTCFDKNSTLFTEMQPNVFVAVHVHENSLRVVCPNHDVYNVTGKLTYGSLRIITHCACSFEIHQKTVARSSGPPCQGHETVNIDVLLPAHWTTLTDLLPFNNDGKEDLTKFQHMDEIFNERFMDPQEENKSFITTDVSIISVAWNLFHSMIIIYVLFRINVASAGAVAQLTSYQLTEAAEHHYCKLNDDLYYLLYAIIILCSMAFVPPLIGKFYSFIRHQFWHAVTVAADQKLANI